MFSYSKKWEVLVCISNIILLQIKVCLRLQTAHIYKLAMQGYFDNMPEYLEAEQMPR